MTDNSIEYPKKQFFLLWFFCLIGSWSILPYIYYLGIIPPSKSILNTFFISTTQAAIFFGLACYLSYKILPKTDLHFFAAKNTFKQVLFPGVISAVCVGVGLIFLDQTIFQYSNLSKVYIPLWAGALASIYGAVNEEALLRLFYLPLSILFL